MRIIIQFIFLLFTVSLFSQSWHKADQPDGGLITFIDASPLDTNQIVIMVEGPHIGYIYYSGNGGLSWEKIGETNTYETVRIDVINNRIYAKGSNIVEVTTNYGRTWDTLLTEVGYIRDMCINPHNPSEILLVTFSEVYKSSDFGQNWNQVHESNYGFQSISFSPHKPGHVIIKASFSNSILSFDGGNSWKTVSVISSSMWYYYPILFDPEKEEILYTAAEINDTSYTIWSPDYGFTWQIKNILNWSLEYCYQENNKTFFVGSGYSGVHISSDYGYSWNLISQPLKSKTIFYSGKKLYASFNSTGFAVYAGKSIWLTRNKGLKDFKPHYMAVADSLILISTSDNTFRKSGSGPNAEWESVSPDSPLANIVLLDSRTGFGTIDNRVYKTTDGGINWFIFGSIPKRIVDLKIIHNQLFAAFQSSYANESGIISTPIDNPTWTYKLTGFNSRIIYDGTMLYGFHASNSSMLLRSSDLGLNWNEVGLLSGNINYSSFAKKDQPTGVLIGGRNGEGVPPLSRGVVYFINPDGDILKIYDGGGIYGLAAPSDRKELYLIKFSQGQVLKADSIGGTFYLHEEGLPFIELGQGHYNMFYFDSPEYSNKIFTNRGGLMELEINTVVQAETYVLLPEFNLSQNYPNPFNPFTTIKYSLAQKGRVTLSIYDLLGREVIKLIDEEKPAGEYETKWNASSHPSGVYFLRMQAGEFSETRKLLFMK
jgi:photosystem II stability/assembly factor-like uncharacterized protein